VIIRGTNSTDTKATPGEGNYEGRKRKQETWNVYKSTSMLNLRGVDNNKNRNYNDARRVIFTAILSLRDVMHIYKP
jgi:hypothetical protein